MNIKIVTKAVPYEGHYILYRTEFLDEVEVNKEKEDADCISQLEADLLNIGLSLKYLIAFDSQFGIVVKSEYNERHSDKDYKQLRVRETYRCYKESNEKAKAVIITTNIEVFENFYYSLRYYENKLIRIMFARIDELLKSSLIKISMPDDILNEWQMEASRKYR